MKTVNTCILLVVQTVHPRCHDTVICQGFHFIPFELDPPFDPFTAVLNWVTS